jgi:hypothetical protein
MSSFSSLHTAHNNCPPYGPFKRQPSNEIIGLHLAIIPFLHASKHTNILWKLGPSFNKPHMLPGVHVCTAAAIVPTILVVINLTLIHLLHGNLLGSVGNSIRNLNIVVPLNCSLKPYTVHVGSSLKLIRY